MTAIEEQARCHFLAALERSPDHWPAFLARLKEMWSVEPEIADEELRRIQAPTLLIVGDRDIVTPEHAVEMFRSIPDAQLCIVPDAGHGAMPHEAGLSFLLAGDR